MFCLRYDHILKWELFQLMDLDTYQGMLKLLFMKELECIVKSYEAYRQALLTELDTRKQRQQWYAQQPTKNFPQNMWLEPKLQHHLCLSCWCRFVLSLKHEPKDWHCTRSDGNWTITHYIVFSLYTAVCYDFCCVCCERACASVCVCAYAGLQAAVGDVQTHSCIVFLDNHDCYVSMFYLILFALFCFKDESHKTIKKVQ